MKVAIMFLLILSFLISPILCFGGGRYLGNLSSNPYASNSSSNPYGAGNPYSNQSATNPYATNAPQLYDSQGNYKES